MVDLKGVSGLEVGHSCSRAWTPLIGQGRAALQRSLQGGGILRRRPRGRSGLCAAPLRAAGRRRHLGSLRDTQSVEPRRLRHLSSGAPWSEGPLSTLYTAPCEPVTLDGARRKPEGKGRLYYSDSILFPGNFYWSLSVTQAWAGY